MELSHLSEKMDDFVRSKGWYLTDSLRPQTPRNLAISLSLEAGEVLECFQWSEEISDKDTLASEFADVALYLFQLSSVCGIDLEKAILDKLKINASRKWDGDKETEVST